MRIERTHDMVLVRAIVTDPGVWPFVSDDGCGGPEGFEPVDAEGVFHLIAIDKEPMGHYYYHPLNFGLYQGHQTTLPGQRGRKAIRALKMANEWMFDHTPARALVGMTPESNQAAIRVAKWAGMKDDGRIAGGWIKDGQAEDLILSTITKEAG